MRKVISLITVVLILMSNVLVFADITLPEQTKEFYVYDEANLIDSEVEQKIIDVNLKYEQTNERPQIVVATVNNLQGISVEEYAVKLFEKWGIGNKDLNNGVLVLLSLEERKIKIEVGYGLEGAISDSKAGRILDKSLNYLSQGDYSTGLYEIFLGVVKEVDNEYIAVKDNLVTDTNLELIKISIISDNFVGFMIMLILFIIGVFLLIVAIGKLIYPIGNFYNEDDKPKSNENLLRDTDIIIPYVNRNSRFDVDNIPKHKPIKKDDDDDDDFNIFGGGFGSGSSGGSFGGGGFSGGGGASRGF